MTVTRFAPSPNGPLHLGHAYSAVVAHDLAKRAGGRFLLRIEDLDGPPALLPMSAHSNGRMRWPVYSGPTRLRQATW